MKSGLEERSVAKSRGGGLVSLRSRSDLRMSAPSGSLLTAVLAWLVLSESASALPSYARQTGQPCGTCHTDFPALTPYGRRFKLLGYTPGGGQFRTTPFSSNAGIAARAEYDQLRAYAGAANSPPVLGNVSQNANGDDKIWVPPISMMAILGYTHTQADLPPPTDPYSPNNNVVLSPFTAFWGGAITNDTGAFAQVTYNAVPPGGFGDPFGHTWTWDN